jgi:hypothetical protein
MNGRMYDPVIARFLSPDPFVQAPTFTQSYNRYSYVWNNPLKYIDPTGYKASGGCGSNIWNPDLPGGGGYQVCAGSGNSCCSDWSDNSGYDGNTGIYHLENMWLPDLGGGILDGDGSTFWSGVPGSGSSGGGIGPRVGNNSSQRLDWTNATSQQKFDVIVNAFQQMVANGQDRFDMRRHVSKFPTAATTERHFVNILILDKKVPVYFSITGNHDPLMSINIQDFEPVTLNNHRYYLKWNQYVLMNGEFITIHIPRHASGRGSTSSPIVFKIHSHQLDLFYKFLFNR